MPTILEIQCQLKEKGLLKGTSGLKKAQLQDILTNGKTPNKKKVSNDIVEIDGLMLIGPNTKPIKATENYAVRNTSGGEAYQISKGKVMWVGEYDIQRQKEGGHRYDVKKYKNARKVPSNFRFFESDGTPITEFNKLQEKSKQKKMNANDYYNEYKTEYVDLGGGAGRRVGKHHIFA